MDNGKITLERPADFGDDNPTWADGKGLSTAGEKRSMQPVKPTLGTCSVDRNSSYAFALTLPWAGIRISPTTQGLVSPGQQEL